MRYCADGLRGRAAAMAMGLVAAFLSAAPAWAETLVGGAIDAAARWTSSGSPYVVTGDLFVRNGARLSVDAGVTIYLAAGVSVSVESGALDMNGTPSAPIQVLSEKSRSAAAAPGDWNRWILSAGTQPSTLEHVVFEHGRGLLIQGSAPILNHVTLRNHLGPAIEIDLSAAPSGIGLSATGNLLNGIAVPAGDITGDRHWGLRGIPYVLQAGTLSVGASPTVGAVNPHEIVQGTSTTVTLAGSRLGGATAVSANNPGVALQLNGISTDASIRLSVEVDLAAPDGPVDLQVLTDAGELRVPNAFAVVAGVPTITALDPTALIVNQGPVNLLVSGLRYRAGAELLVDGSPVATEVLSTTQLRAALPNRNQAINLVLRVRVPDQADASRFLTSAAVTLPVLANGALGLVPANPTIVLGRTRALTLSLPFDAPAGGFAVDLTSSVPQVLSVPASVTVPAGQRTASVTVTALQVGGAVVSASRSGFLSAQAQVSVTSGVSYSLGPVPLVAVPNAAARVFTIEASDPVEVPVSFSVTSLDPAVVRVDTPTVILGAGQVRVDAAIAGLRDGVATLLVQQVGSSAAPLQTQVFVGNGLAGGALAHSAPVGLIRDAGVELPAGALIGPAVSRPLGLVRNADPGPPPGSTVGPIASRPIGLIRDLPLMAPAGSAVGPVLSRPLGLIRDAVPIIPNGALVTPLVSGILGITRP